MSDPKPIDLSDHELWRILEAINESRIAGHWDTDSPIVEGVSKMLDEARRRGYDIGCLREIDYWATPEPAPASDP